MVPPTGPSGPAPPVTFPDGGVTHDPDPRSHVDPLGQLPHPPPASHDPDDGAHTFTCAPLASTVAKHVSLAPQSLLDEHCFAHTSSEPICTHDDDEAQSASVMHALHEAPFAKPASGRFSTTPASLAVPASFVLLLPSPASTVPVDPASGPIGDSGVVHDEIPSTATATTKSARIAFSYQ
jgi:hypothetical protein